MGMWLAGNETMLQVLFSINVDNSDSMSSFQWGERMAWSYDEGSLCVEMLAKKVQWAEDKLK